MDYEIPGGILVEDAYYVITNLNATKQLTQMVGDPPVSEVSQLWLAHFVVSVFKDKAVRNAGGQPLAYMSDATPSNPFSTTFEYDPDGELPVVQAYAYLMSQPYFADATVDVES
jgi:hypothetical protein